MRTLALLGVLTLACAEPGKPGADPAPVDASADMDLDVNLETGDGPACACSAGIHNKAIVVISAAAELYSYDPTSNEFAKIANLDCPGQANPFSMAVDSRGKAWVLFSSSKDFRTVDLAAPDACDNPGYTPGQAGFELFGMSFSTASEEDRCERIFALSYSGSGPFNEGPGIGSLGVMDPTTKNLSKIATIDYNGGELAGSGNGRLFAFVGEKPAKLVEYDKATGVPLITVPLTGLSKTTASAFAFFGGDVYFFTEQTPPGCAPCLEKTCGAELAACKADPVCADALACALDQFDVTDECGGLMGAALHQCLSSCSGECLPSAKTRKSWVHRLEPSGKLTLVNPAAPIRIVGADASTCVAFMPH